MGNIKANNVGIMVVGEKTTSITYLLHKNDKSIERVSNKHMNMEHIQIFIIVYTCCIYLLNLPHHYIYILPNS